MIARVLPGQHCAGGTGTGCVTTQPRKVVVMITPLQGHFVGAWCATKHNHPHGRSANCYTTTQCTTLMHISPQQSPRHDNFHLVHHHGVSTAKRIHVQYMLTTSAHPYASGINALLGASQHWHSLLANSNSGKGGRNAGQPMCNAQATWWLK